MDVSWKDKIKPHILPTSGVALAYFFSGVAMELLAQVYGYSIPVCAPEGLALGLYLVYGYRALAGIGLGSLIFTLVFWESILPVPNAPFLPFVPVALFIALGAVIQTLAAGWVLKHIVGSINPFNKTRDVLLFIFGVGAVSSTLQTSMAHYSLDVMGLILPQQFWQNWTTWWLGDMMGTLIITPLFIVFRKPFLWKMSGQQKLEALALIILFYVASQIVFGSWLSYWHYPLVYLMFPILVWAAFRFRQQGAVLAILMVSLVAIWGTAQGRGPMAEGTIVESLRLLQFYLLILAVMTLTLCAALSETLVAENQVAQFGRMINESDNEIYLFHSDSLKFSQVNLGARQDLGYTLEELAAMTPLDLSPNLNRQQYEELLKPLREGTRPTIVFESLHQRKDGTTYPTEVRLQLSRTEFGDFFIAIVQDISEKKQADQELFKYRHQLEELVEQRTLELEAMNRQLMHAEKLSATGKMAASIAHEFNNPIFGIRSVLEKLNRRVAMEIKDKEFVSLAIRECDRVSTLIKKLLDFHSPSSEKKETFSFHDAIEDMVLLANKKFTEKNINLVRNYSPDVQNICAVPDQIRQVILNILQNAEEAITEESGTITLSTSIIGDKIKLEIGDTGQGISPNIMKNIFDPFFTTKPAVKGTGLGLSVSYGIIKSHGGEIYVDGPPGGGTLFTILLPIKGKTVKFDALYSSLTSQDQDEANRRELGNL